MTNNSINNSLITYVKENDPNEISYFAVSHPYLHCLVQTIRTIEPLFSHTRLGFPLFYPCELILSHIPVPARREDKKRTAARRPHAGRTSIRYVIVMLKLRHHVASQRIQDFLEVFGMVFQYQMRYLVVSKKKNPLIV